MICGGTDDLNIRYFKAGGVLAGFMSHLILDEIYSVEWKSGAWRLKKSFGTAIKFWGDDGWANFSCYAKLVVVGGMILGEPSVMQQLQSRNPELARRYQELQSQYRGWSDEIVRSVGATVAGCTVARRRVAVASARGIRSRGSSNRKLSRLLPANYQPLAAPTASR